MARNDNNCSVPAGEDRSSARRKEGPRLGLQGRGSVQELGGGGAPYVLGSGRGRGSSVPRVEEEGSSTRVVGARRGAPYGPRLGPGTRGGGVGGGGAPGLETTAALGRGQGCEAVDGP